jgi:CheY-like chemotaxis protein
MARILVIDDYVPILDMLDLMLEGAGHEVVTACSGAAGLELASNWRPDLVLLDVDMPGMDGVNVCGRIKNGAVTTGIPVLLMSGRFGPDVSRRARDAGAFGILPKPFDRERLLMEIQNAVSGNVANGRERS